MRITDFNTGLFTDYYELTMAQGYFFQGRQNDYACFDYFFRSNPFQGGFTVFAGLDDLSAFLESFKYTKDDIQFLREYGFDDQFLAYLENLQLSLSIYSVREGDVVFANEPLVRVEGKIIELQLLETLLLNVLNFESLIATKARRIKMQAGDRPVIDFGLRRAQGLGGLQATRAAYIGGVDKTSNVFSSKAYAIPATGTIAHSWIQSYDDELTSFRDYARLFPENCVLLIDTYDTLNSGLPNAMIVAKELLRNGHQLFGVRLDSGDLAALSKEVRKILDEHDLGFVKIVASNQLDEYAMQKLNAQNAPIDSFGVGTSLVTGQDDPALDGVYKLSYADHHPRMKFSENPAKASLPGVKMVYRFVDENKKFIGDGICFNDYTPNRETTFYQVPLGKELIRYNQTGFEKLLFPFWINGVPQRAKKSLDSIREFSAQRLEQLPDQYKQLQQTPDYPVGIEHDIQKLQSKIVAEKKLNYQSKNIEL
ncbi:nicotinate phosphoribosyltransferase [Mangrovibacterium lignilyticum]|uniref:nicotinate phosphoribosyltransferase n=1 Tax=Mangrovibacterium lignilyticum TaxID=2668052 RepID=UPI0013D22980|nr:nicotinate phosphoribosyltransferase [Mangrovibacterium lignilyticum]